MGLDNKIELSQNFPIAAPISFAQRVGASPLGQNVLTQLTGAFEKIANYEKGFAQRLNIKDTEHASRLSLDRPINGINGNEHLADA